MAYMYVYDLLIYACMLLDNEGQKEPACMIENRQKSFYFYELAVLNL